MLLNKGTRVKKNHGLSANRSSNNWAQELKMKKWPASPLKKLTISIISNSYVLNFKIFQRVSLNDLVLTSKMQIPINLR